MLQTEQGDINRITKKKQENIQSYILTEHVFR